LRARSRLDVVGMATASILEHQDQLMLSAIETVCELGAN
jgi:hypothetical protein